jgi:hypothetical protein
MNKPYILLCNSKAKVPADIGHYATLRDAEKAIKEFQKRNDKVRAMMKKYPGGYVEDLYCDLKIIGPGLEE